MKIALIIILSLVGVYVLLSLIIAIVIVQLTVYPKLQSKEMHIALNKKYGRDEGTENFERKPFKLCLKDGYIINGDVSINDSKKFMIVSHGHSANREAVMKYARVFYKLGYSIVLFDQRGHGENKRTRCTMSKLEQLDLLEVIDFVKTTYGNEIELGLFGVSMGGASTLSILDRVEDIKFAVIDCAFASYDNTFKALSSFPFFPNPFCKLFGKIWMKAFHGISFKEMRPINHIKGNKIPLLLIQGGKDNLVCPYNQKEILESLPKDCYVEHYIFDGAGHDASVSVNYEKYYEITDNFIKNVKKGEGN